MFAAVYMKCFENLFWLHKKEALWFIKYKHLIKNISDWFLQVSITFEILKTASIMLVWICSVNLPFLFIMFAVLTWIPQYLLKLKLEPRTNLLFEGKKRNWESFHESLLTEMKQKLRNIQYANNEMNWVRRDCERLERNFSDLSSDMKVKEEEVKELTKEIDLPLGEVNSIL